MKKCVFCNNLSDWKEIDAESHIKHKYNVALVLHNASGRGRTVDYNVRGLGFKLNYCPECGAKMDEEKNERLNQQTGGARCDYGTAARTALSVMAYGAD